MAIRKMTVQVSAEHSAAKSSSRITDGILLAVISFVGYLLTYMYERGFASAFGISSELVEVSLTRALYLVALLGLGVFIVLVILKDFINDLERKSTSPLRKSINLLIGASMLALGVDAFLLLGRGLNWLLASIGVIVVVVYLLPLFKRSNRRKPYAERFAAFYASPRSKESQTITSDTLVQRIDNSNVYVIIMLVIFFVSFVTLIGRIRAQQQQVFEVLIDESNTVVLRIYGDKLVTAEFDPCTKEIRHGISVRKISDSTPIRLQKMQVGPLDFKPVTTLDADRPLGL